MDVGLPGKDPDGFYRRIAHAYAACREAVEQELTRQQAHPDRASVNGRANGTPKGATNGTPVSESDTSPNGHGYRSGDNRHGGTHGASEKQMGFARQLAKAIPGLGLRRLETLAQKMFRKPLAGLSAMDASALIDTLKALKAREIDLTAVLQGGPL